MSDLTVPLPEEYADLMSDWSINEFRGHLLQDGLLTVKDELHGIAEENLRDRTEKILESLRKCIKQLQWLEVEIAKLAEEDR